MVLGHVAHRFGALLQALDELRSTVRRGPGIPVMFIRASRLVVGGVATTSLPDEAPVNNLLTLRS
jgi:hypothetical protein